MKKFAKKIIPKKIEQAYMNWIKQYIILHDKRHPQEMGAAEVKAFINHLAVDRNMAASTQNQALSVILFLYREVLNQPRVYVYFFNSLRS